MPEAGTAPGQLSPHFKAAEFACRHCGKLAAGGVPQALVDVLEDVRGHFGVPVVVNSGYRCPKHNAAVGGVPGSQHVKGTAADIVVKGVQPWQVADYVEAGPLKGKGGVGRYRSFTHVDVRRGPARWAG